VVEDRGETVAGAVREQKMGRACVIDQGAMPAKLVEHHTPIVGISDARIHTRLSKREHDVVDAALDQPIRIGTRNYSPALGTVAHGRRRTWRTSMVDLDRKLRSRKIVVSLETQLLHVAKEPIAIEIGIYRRKLICAHIKVEVGPIQPGGRIVLQLWHRW